MANFTAAKILADSVGPHGIRLTTLEVVFPRPYLAEFNTHRMLSRNSASSRAIPTEQQIERVERSPYVPIFGARVKGMGVGEPLSDQEQYEAQQRWLDSRDAAVQAAKGLLHVDKSRANRLLEPFAWQTVIVSSTEWDNFFALRDHADAQPEFRALAREMREVMAASTPATLEVGAWHLPLTFTSDVRQCWEDVRDPLFMAKVSAGRCAKVSYMTHAKQESVNIARGRWESLSSRGHWSPGEHPAMCLETGQRVGNFEGWRQLRKMYHDEAVFSG